MEPIIHKLRTGSCDINIHGMFTAAKLEASRKRAALRRQEGVCAVLNVQIACRARQPNGAMHGCSERGGCVSAGGAACGPICSAPVKCGLVAGTCPCFCPAYFNATIGVVSLSMQSTPAQVHLAQQEIEAAQAAVRSELARFERAAAALSKHVTQLQQGFKQVGP